MIDLDTKIKALCPYYVDTNSVYDGTTNIIMHTFTGLLASLDLGDHTNFTAIPAIGTNVATYGPWAWRNYVVAWQERYKVLEALKVSRAYIDKFQLIQQYGYSYAETTNWISAKGLAEDYFLINKYVGWADDVSSGWIGFRIYSHGYKSPSSGKYDASIINEAIASFPNLCCTNVGYLEAKSFVFPSASFPPGQGDFYDNGQGVQSNVWNLISYPFGLAEDSHPVWLSQPDAGTNFYYGMQYLHGIYATWDFQYATNKYW